MAGGGKGTKTERGRQGVVRKGRQKKNKTRGRFRLGGDHFQGLGSESIQGITSSDAREAWQSTAEWTSLPQGHTPTYIHTEMKLDSSVKDGGHGTIF